MATSPGPEIIPIQRLYKDTGERDIDFVRVRSVYGRLLEEGAFERGREVNSHFELGENF